MNDRNPLRLAGALGINSNDDPFQASAFSVSPFDDRIALPRASDALAEPAVNEPALLNHNALRRQATSPVARLLYGSVWVLKAWQLDLELPPTVSGHLDQRLSETLHARFGAVLDIDELHIHFNTDLEPAVGTDGQECFEQRLSLRDLGREILNPPEFHALRRCAEPDRALSAQAPGLTIRGFFSLLIEARWVQEYEQMQHTFWLRHGTTWEMLAKLTFLDGLERLYSRKRLNGEGYRLALDAMGLARFPQTLAELQSGQPRRADVRCLTLDGVIIPGIFHLRSSTTGHCYLHLPGPHAQCHEYISDDAPWRPEQVLTALNASSWHRLHLNTASGSLALGEPTTDVFAQLRLAQAVFSVRRITEDSDFELTNERFDDRFDGRNDDDPALLIEPAMAVISMLDHWQGHEPLPGRIPTPLRVADRLMSKWLKQNGLRTAARNVFIRYVPGPAARPWGNPRIAAANVMHIPDGKPISLSHALMSNFRATHPRGYDDDGRWVAYADPDGQGRASLDGELNVSAVSVEAYIASVDFLDVMKCKLEQFWHQQRAAIERSLWSTFVSQALISLKRGEICQDDFGRIVSAVEQVQQAGAPGTTRWTALGFYLGTGLPFSSECPACTGLLLLNDTDRNGGVLYQAGQQQPFVPFRDREHLVNHLIGAAADPQWRDTMVNYAPNRRREKLSHILEVWSGLQSSGSAASILRPWADPLYRPNIHAARQHLFCEQEVPGSPVAFMWQTLWRNSQSDAEDSIVTDRELTISAWTEHANRMQLLLAPMGLLLTAAAVTALTAGVASIALNVQATGLPGDREWERRNLTFAILSLGLLQMGPATPRLLRAFNLLRSPARTLGRSAPSVPLRDFGSWLRRTTHQRKTIIKPFFNGTGLMKTWSVPGNAMFNTSAVQVWKLGRKFLLWTSDRAQARTLVVSSHGYYLPWTRTTAIPNGTELRTYAPHGHELVDPMLHRIASQSVRPYAMLDGTRTLPAPGVGPFSGLLARDTMTAGTTLQGHIKNYTLAKFQSERYESYRDISQIVRNSHQPPLPGPLAPAPMDVLTVRNRFGVANPTLQDLFGELHRHGIHYDRILLVHCRCPAIGSLLGRSPSFVAPQGPSPVTP
jgi:hypothetical protein